MKLRGCGKFFTATVTGLAILLLTTTGLFADELKFSKQSVQNLWFGKNSTISYLPQIENKNSDLTNPYNVIMDDNRNIWIVDPVKKQCLVMNNGKPVKIFAAGREFEKIDKKFGFQILAVNNSSLLLERGIIDIKTGKTIADFNNVPLVAWKFRRPEVIKAGFTKKGGMFVNSPYRLIALDKNGAVIAERPDLKISETSAKNSESIESFYFDRFSGQNYYVRRFRDKIYLTNAGRTVRIPLEGQCSHIYYVDKKGRFYLTDGVFNNNSDETPIKSNLTVLAHNGKKLGALTFQRKYGVKKILKYRPTFLTSSREDIIGITPDGEIYSSNYIQYKGIEIAKYTPGN